jgi:tripartite-type tricarboxylate transporter receptor subunit TctC
MKRREFLASALAGGATLSLGGFAFAEEYPGKPITWIIPLAAGGPTDQAARLIGESMNKDFGQPVLIENRPGAGGVTGTYAAVRSNPDGYTLVLASPGIIATNPLIYPNHPFDPATDLIAVHGINDSPNLVVANPTRPYKTLAEFVAYAKENPGTVKYGSGGNGTATHMAAELFQQVAGIELLHVPYKGLSAAMTDTISGIVDVIFDYPVSTVPLAEAGKVLPLAIMAEERIQVLPDTPTVGEFGYGDALSSSWSGLFVPKGTDAAIVRKLSDAVTKALKDPTISKTFLDAGRKVMVDLDSEAFPVFVKGEIEKWGALVKRTGLSIK